MSEIGGRRIKQIACRQRSYDKSCESLRTFVQKYPITKHDNWPLAPGATAQIFARAFGDGKRTEAPSLGSAIRLLSPISRGTMNRMSKRQSTPQPQLAETYTEWSQYGNCPSCGRTMRHLPALSRKDYRTRICSERGTHEALEGYRRFGT